MEVASCKTEPDLTYDSKLSRETLPPQLSHRGSRGVEKKWEEKEVLHRKEKFVSLSLFLAISRRDRVRQFVSVFHNYHTTTDFQKNDDTSASYLLRLGIRIRHTLTSENSLSLNHTRPRFVSFFLHDESRGGPARVSEQFGLTEPLLSLLFRSPPSSSSYFPRLFFACV